MAQEKSRGIKLTKAYAIRGGERSTHVYVHLQEDSGKHVMPHKITRYPVDKLPKELAELRGTSHKINYILTERQLRHLCLGEEPTLGLVRRILGIG